MAEPTAGKIFLVGADPEDEVRRALRDYLKSCGVAAIVDGEEKLPRTRVIVKAASETRPAIEARCDNRRAEWSAWSITLDIVSDGLSGARRDAQTGAGEAVKAPVYSTTSAALRAAFDSLHHAERNTFGLYSARMQTEGMERSGESYVNPRGIVCEVFLYLE